MRSSRTERYYSTSRWPAPVERWSLYSTVWCTSAALGTAARSVLGLEEISKLLQGEARAGSKFKHDCTVEGVALLSSHASTAWTEGCYELTPFGAVGRRLSSPRAEANRAPSASGLSLGLVLVILNTRPLSTNLSTLDLRGPHKNLPVPSRWRLSAATTRFVFLLAPLRRQGFPKAARFSERRLMRKSLDFCARLSPCHYTSIPRSNE